MVERLQDALKGATIVDLDGSLISGNSMHIFMKRLPGMLMKRHSPGAAICALWQTWLRSIHLISHRSMKWHLTKIARRHLQDSDWDSLAEVIAGSINPHVRDLVQSRRNLGCLTYIATAAAEEYTLPICRSLGYDGVLSTKFTDRLTDYKELNRHAKHNAIEKLLQDEQLRLESFLTDHIDDLPTAKSYPHLSILVGSSEKVAAEFRDAGITRYIP